MGISKLVFYTKIIFFWFVVQTGIYINNDVFLPVPEDFIQNIHFNLYNGSMPEDYISIPYKEAPNLTQYTEAFNSSYKTIFYFPGWGEKATAGGMFSSVKYMSRALRTLNQTNLIVFDYLKLIDYPTYLEPLWNSAILGNAIAQFFAKFIPKVQTKEKLHFISHSLGCQLMSHTARSYQVLTGQKLALLTGLDCAKSGYRGAASHLRPSDADYTQEIHTNFLGISGIIGSYGHINFYPNGGRFQPFCFNSFQAFITTTCNHGMSFVYYVLSILYPEMFIAKKCSSLCGEFFPVMCFCNSSDTTYMGYHVDVSKTGNYYLKKRKDPPLGLYKEGLNFGLDIG